MSAWSAAHTPGMESGPITSAHNPRFRAVVGLRDARDRRLHGRFLIDGRREVERALDAGVGMVETWLSEEAATDAHLRPLLARLDQAGARRVVAAPHLMQRLAYGDRDEGLVVVALPPSTSLERLTLSSTPVVGVIEGVEKPGNLGAIVRSADGAGLDALIVAVLGGPGGQGGHGSDPWHPNAIRASVGTVFSLPLAIAPLADVLAFLRRHQLRLMTTRVDGARDYTQADLTGPVAIVLGAEADGLSAAWDGPDVTALRIPMRGRADSLNVSVSAALLFYEALRQRSAAD